MARSDIPYTLRERNLIRLNRWFCLEEHHVKNLVKSGDVKIFDSDQDLDPHPEIYPYPFGNVGTKTISCVEFETKGSEALRKLADEDSERYQKYADRCRSPEHYSHIDKILFTVYGIPAKVNSGLRDQLIVLNKGLTRYCNIPRGWDPDVEHLSEDYYEDVEE